MSYIAHKKRGVNPIVELLEYSGLIFKFFQFLATLANSIPNPFGDKNYVAKKAFSLCFVCVA